MGPLSRASELARDLARSGSPPRAAPDGLPRWARIAIGDPQAPLDLFLGVLASHRLLTEDGRVRADVALYAMGDYFDWGGAADAERAGEDGLALLAWLASHAPDHVHLVLGNHDLARVGELADFDDATFREARLQAADAYARGDEAAERKLLERFPALPTAEAAARDFASFTVAQRELVVALLRARRLRVAFALGGDVLLTHAGVTSALVGREEESIGDARSIAASLNDRLDSAVQSWTRGPLAIRGLHQPGNAARGEGGGIFYHRPTSLPITATAVTTTLTPSATLVASGRSLSRRFDPRELPPGITQVVGHIGDEKCRALMPDWSQGEPEDGVLRSLVTDGRVVRYAKGVLPIEAPDFVREGARIVFTDGTMRRARAGAYETLDLDRMTAFVP